MKHIHLLATLAMLLPLTVGAQVYRCDVDGRTVYSQTPCADDATRVDLGPNSTVSMNARELAMQREIDALRAEVQRLQVQLSNALARPDTGRTKSDLRAVQTDSFNCKQAMRSYEISANTRAYDTEQKRVAAYAACGMREPDRGPTVIVR